jgi:hypothetical protein
LDPRASRPRPAGGRRPRSVTPLFCRMHPGVHQCAHIIRSRARELQPCTPCASERRATKKRRDRENHRDARLFSLSPPVGGARSQPAGRAEPRDQHTLRGSLAEHERTSIGPPSSTFERRPPPLTTASWKEGAPEPRKTSADWLVQHPPRRPSVRTHNPLARTGAAAGHWRVFSSLRGRRAGRATTKKSAAPPQ